MEGLRAAFAALLVVSIPSGGLLAQGATRRLTTVDALRQFPGYYHLQPVLLRGELATIDGGPVMLRADEHEIRLVTNDARVVDGPVEVRGQLIDVGRLEPGDPRIAAYAGARDQERWPKPGEELFVNVSSVGAVTPASSPTIRSLALEPWRFVGQKVKVVGQFRGRNLFGDVAAGPSKSPHDFVLRAADAALWVTGLRPRGKGFELNVDARVDTGRWLEVAGIVRHEGGLVSIEAATIALTTEPTLTTEPEEPPAVVPPPPPVEVVFSAPVDGEADVATNTPVRIQFSRGIDPESLKGRIRISYLQEQSMERGEPQPPPIAVVTSYDAGTRALELKFERPLERFRTVRIELLEGVTAFDGAPVLPWTLMFSVGG